MTKPSGRRSAHGTLPQAWRNFFQPMPLDRKMRLFYRNLRIRLRTRQACCGHAGEPGC